MPKIFEQNKVYLVINSCMSRFKCTCVFMYKHMYIYVYVCLRIYTYPVFNAVFEMKHRGTQPYGYRNNWYKINSKIKVKREKRVC